MKDIKRYIVCVGVLTSLGGVIYSQRIQSIERTYTCNELVSERLIKESLSYDSKKIADECSISKLEQLTLSNYEKAKVILDKLGANENK